jgi:hypothetical protein
MATGQPRRCANEVDEIAPFHLHPPGSPWHQGGSKEQALGFKAAPRPEHVDDE